MLALIKVHQQGPEIFFFFFFFSGPRFAYFFLFFAPTVRPFTNKEKTCLGHVNEEATKRTIKQKP